MNFILIITTCFHALFLLVPFAFTWVNSELFEINKMLLVYGFAVVIGGLWLVRMVVERRLIWKKHPAVLLVMAFLAGQLLATVFSIHFRTSLLGYYSRLNGGFFSSLAYATLFLALLNNVPKKHAFSLLLTNAVAVVLAALYAIPEHFGASPSCYLMLHEWSTACWKQDVQARVFGTFGQPNWLAMYVIGLAPVIVLFAQKHIGAMRKLWIGAAVILAMALWFTKSRSGLLAFGAMGITWAALHYQPLWLKKIKQVMRPKWLRWGAGIAAIFLLLLIGTFTSKLIPATETESFDLSQGSESGSIRLIVWQGALKVWQRYPWFGSGPGTFGYSYYQDRPTAHNLTSEWNNLYNKAHNEFLNYLAETGLVGALTYLVLLGGLLWLLLQKMGRTPDKPTLARTAFLSLVGLSVAHFFGFSTVTSNLLFFLVPAIVFLDEEDTGKRVPLKPWQKGVIGANVITCLFLLYSIGKTWQADYVFNTGKKLEEQTEYAAALEAYQDATMLIPQEALYYDELANLYSKLAVVYSLTEEPEAGAQLGEAAIQNSDYALVLNPRHLNFYKTRTRALFLLAQIDEKYYLDAERTLKAALALSPTDAQLWFNLALAQQEAGKFEDAVKTFEYTVALKSDYIRARTQLGDLLVQLGRVEEGKEQYRFILEKLSSTDKETREKLNNLEGADIE